jgi:hypothetical protein
MILKKTSQGSLEKQMFHNRRTLQEITKIREENIEDNVMSLFVLQYISFNP